MDWYTWSPFQSEDTKAICSNMTATEKIIAAKRGALYGFWVAISLAIPMGLSIFRPSLMSLCLISVFVIVHILCIPVWQRKQREFLCGTEWARSQGFTPEDLKLLGN